MTAAPTLQWETLDLEAAYPETVYRAAGTECEYRIAHYRRDRDKKLYFGDHADDLWTLSEGPITGMGVSYHGTLDDAKARAANYETRITA